MWAEPGKPPFSYGMAVARMALRAAGLPFNWNPERA